MRYFQAIDFVWQIIFAIALPAVIFGLGGRWLDIHLEVTPAFTLLGFLASLALSYVLIMRRTRRFLADQKNEKNSSKQS